MKAIIVGAGIGGLTTAIALQQIGVEVSVYERAPELKAIGAGLSIWANALNVFDALGIGEALRSHSKPNFNAGLHDWHGGTLSRASDQSAYEIAVVHRAELQAVLLEAYEGEVYLNRVATHYENRADGICLHFADGSQVHGDLLIAGDGIHSPIRKQMHPDSNPIYSGYTAWRGVVEFSHDRIGAMWGESWGHGQRFGITPLSDERIYWFATANEPEAQQYSADENKALLLGRFADWHAPIIDLIRATQSSTILYNNIHSIAPLSGWVDQRAVLLGDAAHAMTPNMGQGACQAIEDAYALAHFIHTQPTIDSALACYDRVRRPRAEFIMKQSQRIGQMGQLENPALVWLRDTAMRLTPPSVMQKTLDAVVGYDIHSALQGV